MTDRASLLLLGLGGLSVLGLVWVIDRPYESLTLNDAFSRVSFEYSGSFWIEAPYKGVVTDETIGSSSISVSYETASLLINKLVDLADHSTRIEYTVSTRLSPSRLMGMEIDLWIPWGRSLEQFSETSDSVKLVLDRGELSVSFIGRVLSVEASRDPTYGQMMVHVVFGMEGSSDRAGFIIESPWTMNYSQELTSRPFMERADKLVISLGRGLFGHHFGMFGSNSQGLRDW